MKLCLSIILVIAICGLATYMLVYESGWVIATHESPPALESREVAEIIKKATAYRKAGQSGKAIEILKKAFEKDRDNFALAIELGRSYEQNGDIDLAVSAYEKASEIEPRHYLSYKLLGFLYFNHKKDKAKSQKYLEQSLALNPTQPDVKRFLDTMKGQPVAIPKRPPIPTKHGRNQHPITPTVPDPRPKLPKLPRPGGR